MNTVSKRHVLAGGETATKNNRMVKQSHILVVDDNESHRMRLTEQLSNQNYAVTAVSGCQDALHQIADTAVDLVLLDARLPAMSNYEMLHIMQRHSEWQHIPIIILSDPNDADSVMKCIQLGARDYLSKPVNGKLLQIRIEINLEKQRLHTIAQKRLSELTIMQQIDAELNAALDVQRTMQITLEWALRQAGGDAGFMGVLHEEQVRVLAASGYPYELNEDATLVPSAALPAVHNALLSGKMAYEPDTAGTGLLMRTHSQLAAPVIREGRHIALLVLESTTPHFWPEHTVSFLERLCQHAAIAIANAQLYEVVQTANDAKTEFVSFVSHELKMPMTTIGGYTQLLLSGDFGEVSKTQAKFLRTIRANVNRMSRLVSDLEDVSRIEAGRLQLQAKEVPVAALIEEVLASTQAQIAEKAQELQLDVAEDLPPVWGDRARLLQILTNLVSNAHKYTPRNGRITIRAQKLEEMNGRPGPVPMLHLSVADNGMGIRPEDQERIFTKFFRGSDEQALQLPGTGLGLNITKNLVELHDGRIWFESQHQQGTTFHVTIPAAVETAVKEEARRAYLNGSA